MRGQASGDLTLASLEVLPFRQQERVHVRAGDGAVAAQVEDPGDLDQGEPGRLAAADEREPRQHRGVVLPVAIAFSLGPGEQASAFVEADRLCRHPRHVGDLSNAHYPTVRLDLVPQIKL